MSAPTDSGGWLESLRRMGESLLALVRGRFELFAVEWQEEKLRLLRLLIWLAVAVALGAAGLLLVLATLALWLWEVAGYLGLIGLAMATLAAASGLVWRLRRAIRTGPQPFTQTLAEFRKDSECLGRRN